MSLRRTLLLTLALLCACTATASAAPSMQVGVADDRILMGDRGEAARYANEWADKGVDVVRIIARWGAIAPAVEDRVAPEGFDPTDPNDPRYAWGNLDQAVGVAQGAGLDVVITVSGWGPVWGTEFPVKDNPRYKPDPAKFAAFATAVARRYGPTVDRYIVWNEPNMPAWLQPQSECTSSRRCAPSAPHVYRRILRAADPALRKADPGASVAMGSLAPRGTSGTSANGALKPLVFMRAFGCVTAKYRRTRTQACRGFKPATANLFAYHPHSLKLAPNAHDRDKDNASLGDLPRLTGALDRIQKAGGFKVRGASRIPLYLDEYAYQTRPPDKVLGVSPQLQARWLQQGAAIAAQNSRVRALIWYVWKDEPLGSSGQGWQSGVHFLSGKDKPSAAAFARPFWAYKARRGVARLWGQMRPGGRHQVTIERKRGSGWKRVATVGTDRFGGFRRDVRIRTKTTFRFRAGGARSDTRVVAP